MFPSVPYMVIISGQLRKRHVKALIRTRTIRD